MGRVFYLRCFFPSAHQKKRGWFTHNWAHILRMS